jgi:type IV secretory pathway VirB10-like protein
MDAKQTPPASDPPPVNDPVRATIRDRRLVPQGMLPRQMQTWIMVGLAVLILGVILMTGRPEPAQSTMPVAAAPAGLIAPARVQSYQERLAEQEARLRRDTLADVTAPALGPVDVFVPPPPAPVDPSVDERWRREEQSLFADNVAFTRRANASTGRVDDQQHEERPVEPSSNAGSVAAATSTPGALVQPAGTGAGGSVEGLRHETLTEGTVVETVLVNRLDGTFQGPVDCVVTTPVYSRDRQAVVIPAGARVLGTAAAVQSWGESRLAVRFHRLVVPDGRTYRLDSFPGLNQIGETGLKDAVDRHYFQVFGASLAIGAIAGLAQFGTRGGFDPSFSDAARQSAGSSLATSTARVLERYLNVLPTVTIREGHRIKVVLTGDLQLPAYAPLVAVQGGV